MILTDMSIAPLIWFLIAGGTIIVIWYICYIVASRHDNNNIDIEQQPQRQQQRQPLLEDEIDYNGLV